MPATSRRSKSEAYEKGIREGQAMAARARNMKSSDPEEEEEEEEEEMDMAMGSHSRKRSAKGAKHTKPATDGYGKKPMDAECGCSDKKGGKCDGNCGSMRKRGDSLSPLEYLDACELGIQDRSTTYIRARLDAAARFDLKCGKGSISEGEKCTKGPATKAEPPQYKRGTVTPNTKAAQRLRTAANVAAAAGALAPIAGLASGSSSGMVAGFGAATTAFKAAGALNTFAKAQETSSAVGKARLKKQATYRALSAGGSAIGTAAVAASMTRTARRASTKQNASSKSRNVGSNKAVKNPFKDLDISENASAAEIKKKWIQLMRENHPDVGGDTNKAQKINAAYQEIMRRRGKLDSVYADGFTIDWDTIAV